MDLKIREVEQKDLKDLYRLTFNAWYQEMAKDFPKETEASCWLDVYSYINRSTFARLAEVDGQVAGVIFSNVFGKKKHLRLLQENSIKHLITLLEGDDSFAHLFKEQIKFEDKASDQFHKESGVDYQAELVLFIVDPAFQGQGIGKTLYQACQNEFEKAGVKNFFLYTGTFSNYHFYDSRGLRQVGKVALPEETNATNALDNPPSPSYFIMYDNQ